VQREHVLNHELRGVFVVAIYVLLVVEANHVVALCEQPFGPPAKTAKQVNR
jgi:hypothetical protein